MVLNNAKNRLALIGANGMLAGMIQRLAPGDYEVLPFDLPAFDLTDRDQVLRILAEANPQVIVNCAAYTNVDGAEKEEALAAKVNGDGPGYLAEAALEIGATLVHISTDYVFDGTKTEPYTEEDPTNPVSAYGRTKLLGEEAIIASGLDRYFILRTSWLYGPGGKNFVETVVRLAAEREALRIVVDQVGCPTFTEDLARAIFRLLEVTRDASPVTRHGIYGLYHLSNEESCSWHAFTEAIVGHLKQSGANLRVKQVVPIRTEEYPLPAERPAYSVFSKEKYRRATGTQVPPWQDGLKRYFDVR